MTVAKPWSVHILIGTATALTKQFENVLPQDSNLQLLDYRKKSKPNLLISTTYEARFCRYYYHSKAACLRSARFSYSLVYV